MKHESVGTVETHYYHFPSELHLDSGKLLKEVTLAYETYGNLNNEKSNAILVCHALTGDAHAAGWHQGDRKPGWWDSMIGPGKALDTDKYFVICSNILGGCKGSTGPSSVNPDSGKPYGLDFPVMTIGDIVRAQKDLVNHLGIGKLFAVIGGSMGGVQVLQWAVSYPGSVANAIAIATTARSSPQQIAFNEVARIAIVSDPEWKKGNYYFGNPPVHGLALARMIGHITYLSDDSMQEKFSRRLQNKQNYDFSMDMDFEVESYLHYQGQSFTRRFDANSYLYITKALDYFDISKNGSLKEGLKDVQTKFLVIAVSSDWLYPPYQSREIVAALSANGKEATYREIESNYGHDAFLLESGHLNYLISNFLSDVVVADIMKSEIVSIKKGLSIEETARVMYREGITHLPVVSEGNILAGIVTSWDISKAVALKYKSLDRIMTTDVITASPDESIESAAKKMEKHNISALPVIDGNMKILGIIGSDEINRLIGGYA
ncbi:homoserine O-acetyltransferase MetX [Methanolobus halotolerans]|uniref:Homoserine O-acetyltransferase n=1 Tax=Methanolobus halotolerans TaxID=2052935 RepID=A0A4E0QZJ5_9EURY|nr:homoserine O-acetyltransferase [Methanolobus halotolerans]TGC09194.1 homoserine O-acetyltransferase [Methanolobus halotolerans]